jgi:phage terminase Nu1 subunit (DNA packaging protein)
MENGTMTTKTEKTKKVRKENKLTATKKKVMELKKTEKILGRLAVTIHNGSWDRKSSVLSQISIIRQSLDSDIKELVKVMVDELTK